MSIGWSVSRDGGRTPTIVWVTSEGSVPLGVMSEGGGTAPKLTAFLVLLLLPLSAQGPVVSLLESGSSLLQAAGTAFAAAVHGARLVFGIVASFLFPAVVVGLTALVLIGLVARSTCQWLSGPAIATTMPLARIMASAINSDHGMETKHASPFWRYEWYAP